MTDPIRHLTETGHHGSFFIDGGWRKPESTERAPVVNPATEQVVIHIPLGSEADVEHAVHAARRAFPAGPARGPRSAPRFSAASTP
jgi:aldehyde dehydrogenase (NAD+)